MRDALHTLPSVLPGRDDITAALALYRAGAPRGDHLVGTVMPDRPRRRAAVLIPLLADTDDISVLFTLRTAHLHAHAGQVSFPGGGAEDHDVDAIATALRESEEEIGLTRDRVHVLGTLDSYLTVSGYEVTPVVGLIDVARHGVPAWRPDEFEVAEIFNVPLAHIMTPGVLRREAVERPHASLAGASYQTYVCRWNDYNIWGATAGMLRNFVEAISR